MTKAKVLFTAVFGAICSYLGILAIPVFILVVCNIIDYGTGLAAAKYRDPDSKQPVKSYKSIRGIIKKVCMLLLIVVGYMVDIMLNKGLAGTGVRLPDVVSILISCWLIFNEMISILENMTDIGVPIPPFLLPLLKMMQKQAEEKAKAE